MSIRRSMLSTAFMALATEQMHAPIYVSSRGGRTFVKTPLNKKQRKARAKAKRAKIARRKNRK